MRMQKLSSTTSIDDNLHDCRCENIADDASPSRPPSRNESAAAGGWIRVCKLDEISSEGQMYKFEGQNVSILLASQNGIIHAVDSVCTHADADLSAGFLGPDGIRCPLHLSAFGLDDGIPKNPPAEKPLRVYNIKIDDDYVYVRV